MVRDAGFMANPWSPPAWMKSNSSMIGIANGQVGTLRPDSFDPLARYFVKFIQAYQAQGIPIYAITPQNEPLLAPSSYPGPGANPADGTQLQIWDCNGTVAQVWHLP